MSASTGTSGDDPTRPSPQATSAAADSGSAGFVGKQRTARSSARRATGQRHLDGTQRPQPRATAGELSAQHDGTITGSFSLGNVTGNNNAGGFVGINSGTINGSIAGIPGFPGFPSPSTRHGRQQRHRGRLRRRQPRHHHELAGFGNVERRLRTRVRRRLRRRAISTNGSISNSTAIGSVSEQRPEQHRRRSRRSQHRHHHRFSLDRRGHRRRWLAGRRPGRLQHPRLDSEFLLGLDRDHGRQRCRGWPGRDQHGQHQPELRDRKGDRRRQQPRRRPRRVQLGRSIGIAAGRRHLAILRDRCRRRRRDQRGRRPRRRERWIARSDLRDRPRHGRNGQHPRRPRRVERLQRPEQSVDPAKCRRHDRHGDEFLLGHADHRPEHQRGRHRPADRPARQRDPERLRRPARGTRARATIPSSPASRPRCRCRATRWW